MIAKAYRSRALDYMQDHASKVPAVVAARVGRTWSIFRPMDMLEFNRGEGRERAVTAAGLLAYYPVLGLAIAGGFVLARRARRRLWVLVVPVIVATIGVAVTYGQTRFRAAAEPSLVVLAAVALVVLWQHLRPAATSTRKHGSGAIGG